VATGTTRSVVIAHGSTTVVVAVVTGAAAVVVTDVTGAVAVVVTGGAAGAEAVGLAVAEAGDGTVVVVVTATGDGAVATVAVVVTVRAAVLATPGWADTTTTPATAGIRRARKEEGRMPRTFGAERTTLETSALIWLQNGPYGPSV
jgi:hypothetical protein